jgi:hypothetical protein
MKRLSFCLLTALAAGTLGTSANAADSATLVIHIHAEVAPFCRLYTAANDSAVQIVDGQAELGQVREVCNMASGYVVRADFSNLSGGSVAAGGETATVDASGSVRFSYDEARAQTRQWALLDAQQVQPGLPVYLRLSISPI